MIRLLYIAPARAERLGESIEGKEEKMNMKIKKKVNEKACPDLCVSLNLRVMVMFP